MTTAEQAKPSSAVTALSVCVLVFALIGLLGSFIPCLGMFTVYISVPSAIVGIITVFMAKKVNAPRGLPIAGLVIALIASGIAIAQISAMQATGNAAQEMSRKLEQENRKAFK
jgi:hypothetical protein